MRLTEIIPPPKDPQYCGRPEDWPVIERILGMELPKDYKDMLNTYGTGCFFEFCYPLTPFAPFDQSINLLSGDTMRLLRAYKAGREEFPQYSPPFPAFPSEPGLFPWGTTANGDTIFWLRDGSPPNWTTVICDSKFSEEHDHFTFGAAELITRLALGKIESKVFPPDVLFFGAVFKPYSKDKK